MIVPFIPLQRYPNLNYYYIIHTHTNISTIYLNIIYTLIYQFIIHHHHYYFRFRFFFFLFIYIVLQHNCFRFFYIYGPIGLLFYNLIILYCICIFILKLYIYLILYNIYNIIVSTLIIT